MELFLFVKRSSLASCNLQCVLVSKICLVKRYNNVKDR